MRTLHHVAQTDLNLLVILDELLRSRSTTLAARRLGRTQSAISHALARLRLTFDDALFVRAGSALRPTTTAEQLQAPLREVLSQTEGILARSNVAFEPASIERTFVVAGTDYAEIMLMPRLLPVLRKEAPGIDVVTMFLGDDVERAIQARDVDLAFGSRFRALAGILHDAVRDEHMVVLLRKNHPALKKPLTANRYAGLDHVLVTPRGLPGGAVDMALEPLGLTRRVVLRMPHFAAAAAVVARTDLVVTMPAGMAAQVMAFGLVTRPVPVPVSDFTFSIGYSASYENDAAHRWFRTRVIEAGRSA
jgi:DNA-binding transcriptional LysR family regulator